MRHYTSLTTTDRYGFLMNERYSTSVIDYTKLVANRFKFSESDMEDVEKLVWDLRLEQWKGALQIALGGVAVLWAVVASIGWIIRGFMGIPRGKDVRPTG